MLPSVFSYRWSLCEYSTLQMNVIIPLGKEINLLLLFRLNNLILPRKIFKNCPNNLICMEQLICDYNKGV